ncbi:hypothetical protein B0H19DRAFT_1078946 [Mycena capillaripes]|nr:hypothetical protein B0H19DRAFT_1078946 [Mycena capillaripes]
MPPATKKPHVRENSIFWAVFVHFVTFSTHSKIPSVTRDSNQKVISNKHNADKRQWAANKAKGMQDHDATDDDATSTSTSTPEATALARLVGIVAVSGCNKFRKACRDKIWEFSKTLPNNMNAGGKFRKAESILWAKEDQGKWEAAAKVDDGNADWVGIEAVPKDICVFEKFKHKHKELVQANINAVHTWAEQPLNGETWHLDNESCILTCANSLCSDLAPEDSATSALHIFFLTEEGVDDKLAKKVMIFLTELYQATFRGHKIPWTAIASEPNVYYDVAKYQLNFITKTVRQKHKKAAFKNLLP